MTIAYRAAEIADAPFVVSNWSRHFKESRTAGMISDEDWAAVMHRQIQKVIARPDVQTIIAYENTSPGLLYGFISATPKTDPPVIYFLFVKDQYRRAGYARGLLAAIGIDPMTRFAYTCGTSILSRPDKKTGKSILDQIPQAKHQPKYARIVGYVERDRSDRWNR